MQRQRYRGTGTDGRGGGGHTGTDGWMKREEKVECEQVEGK